MICLFLIDIELNQISCSFDYSQGEREDKRSQASQVLGSASGTKPYQLLPQPSSMTVSPGGMYSRAGDSSFCSQRQNLADEFVFRTPVRHKGGADYWGRGFDDERQEVRRDFDDYSGNSRRIDRDYRSGRSERDSGSRRSERDSGSRYSERDSGSRYSTRSERYNEGRHSDRDGRSRRSERDGDSIRSGRDSVNRRSDHDGGSRRDNESICGGSVKSSRSERSVDANGTPVPDFIIKNPSKL